MSLFDAADMFDRLKRAMIMCVVFALSCAAMAQSSAQDPALAKVYFEQGKAAHDGVGQAQDFNLARENYLRASELGSSDALINLGYMYSMGEGVGRDYLIARKYYERAAALGESVAKKNISMMNQAGLGIESVAAPAAVQQVVKDVPKEISEPVPTVDLPQSRNIIAPGEIDTQMSAPAPRVLEAPEPAVIMTSEPVPMPISTPASVPETTPTPKIETPNEITIQIDPKPIETRVSDNVWTSPDIVPMDRRSRSIGLAAIFAAMFVLLLVLIQRERQARKYSEQYFMDTFYEAKRGEICHIYLRRHNGEFTDSEFFVQWNATLKVLIVRFAMQYNAGNQDVMKIANMIKKSSKAGKPQVKSLIRKYDNELLDRTVSDVKAIDSFYHARTSNVKAPDGSSDFQAVTS